MYNIKKNMKTAVKRLETLSTRWEYSTVHYTVHYTVHHTVHTVQYSTVQYSTVQYSTVQYSTVQYSTVHYTLQFISCTDVPGRISTSQRKLNSKNTDYMRQNGTMRQMNYRLIIKFM